MPLIDIDNNYGQHNKRTKIMKKNIILNKRSVKLIVGISLLVANIGVFCYKRYKSNEMMDIEYCYRNSSLCGYPIQRAIEYFGDPNDFFISAGDTIREHISYSTEDSQFIISFFSEDGIIDGISKGNRYNEQ